MRNYDYIISRQFNAILKKHALFIGVFKMGKGHCAMPPLFDLDSIKNLLYWQL